MIAGKQLNQRLATMSCDQVLPALAAAPQLSVFTCTTAINRLWRCRMYAEALSVLPIMEARGVAPNERVYNASITACEKSER